MKHKPGQTFDVRFYLKDEFARVARKPDALSEKPKLDIDEIRVALLFDVLDKFGMSLHNQLDEFQEYVDKQKAIKDWEKAYPNKDERMFHQQLLAMTERTLADPQKRDYLSREFTVERPGGNPEFLGAFKNREADKIILALQSLYDTGIYDEGPRPTEKGVRQVYAPPRHPGTTVSHPSTGGPKK